jgi:hypothetical protein
MCGKVGVEETPARWHYTTGKNLIDILSDGFIRPATAFVPKGVRPIVWFTSSLVWEETANKSCLNRTGEMIFLDREQTRVRCDGLFRIGVSDDFPLHTYLRISRESHESPTMIASLLKVAVKKGSNPERDWWGTFHNVDCSNWTVIEKSDQDSWKTVDEKDFPTSQVSNGRSVTKSETEEFESYMLAAVKSYKEGTPVIVMATDSSMLHGMEICRLVADSNVPVNVAQIQNVDPELFYASSWPATLEAMRQIYVEKKR